MTNAETPRGVHGWVAPTVPMMASRTKEDGTMADLDNPARLIETAQPQPTKPTKTRTIRGEVWRTWWDVETRDGSKYVMTWDYRLKREATAGVTGPAPMLQRPTYVTETGPARDPGTEAVRSYMVDVFGTRPAKDDPTHCERCAIPGYRCNEEEARVQRGEARR